MREIALGTLSMSFKAKRPLPPDPRLVKANLYDIVPTMAFVQDMSVYSLAASYGMRYLFTGGEDGLVRMYDFAASVSGRQLLTVGQRHMLPDSITKSGVLAAWWENEQPLLEDEYAPKPDGTYVPKLSPVYSLAAQAEAQWLCSGLQSGGIALQTVRGAAEPGQIKAYLQGHTNAVSDMALSYDETLLLSGSWDRSAAIWDLNTGQRTAQYTKVTSQVSVVAWQPAGGLTPSAPSAPSAEDDDRSMGSLFGSDEEADSNGDDQDGVKQEKEEDGSTETKPDPEDARAGNGQEDDEENSGTADGAGDGTEDNLAGKNSNVVLVAAYNGLLELYDKRQPTRVSWFDQSAAPPWCMSACWSCDGNLVYAGRRNSTVEEYDLRMTGAPSHTLKFPPISGAVTCVMAMPNNHTLLCGSHDNIRLYDIGSQRKTPFIIVPGHHGTVVSRMLADETGSFLVTASGGRGWLDNVGDLVLGYEVAPDPL